MILGLAALMAFLIYLYPPVHRQVNYRADLAFTYLRGVIQPAGPVPTSLPQPTAALGSASTPTVLPTLVLPSPTSTGTTATPLPPTPSPTPLPEAISLPAPAWEVQDINNCGPASLAMFLRFYGWEGNQYDISNLIKPIPEDRNVNPEELVYYVRTRAGWLDAEFRVNGNLDLLKQLLAAGFPVLIEESFYFEDPFWPNDDLWAAHYLLLTAYDQASQTFTGQDSFHGPDQKIPYATLADYWRIFNRVYLLVYPPAQEATIRSLLGTDWDLDANRQHALEASQAETRADPKDAYAWFNLGSNLVYFERYAEAANAYDTARQLGLPQRMLRYQFGPFFAYFHAQRNQDLLALTQYALQRTPNSEEALLWHGWGLYRDGNTAGAVREWRTALLARPGFEDALYALNFVGASP